MDWYWGLYALLAALSAGVAALLIELRHMKNDPQLARQWDALAQKSEQLGQNIAMLSSRQDMLIQSTTSSLEQVSRRMAEGNAQNEQKLENMRRTLSESVARMQEDNARQLEGIRKTVDEKLQDTLEKKLNDSFQLVSERLEQVYKGLGEMQTLAVGVGDLKRVLSNVKTRGVLGEIQLGAILEQLLTPEQYSTNVATKRGSQGNVEYAVKLPGEDGKPVWLPIDAKFPADAYSQLLDAYESADPAQVDGALKQLKQRVRGFAKDIRDKYIDPPNTTDFAILFLPVEGLYAELVRADMVETLQREFRVSLAGPTTMGALLNSLQMGFQTLAIQKRSSEVWKVLSSVKSEFDKFGVVLENTQRRLVQAGDELDKLVGVRTRQIQSTLKNVQSLTDGTDSQPAETPETDSSGEFVCLP